MSQLSTLSTLSDIIPDVEQFIAENGMVEDVGHLMEDVVQAEDEKEDRKPEVYNLGPLYPPEHPIQVIKDEYSGPLNFEVLVQPEEKTPWEFSPNLRKIYLTLGLKFPVTFKLGRRPVNKRLFVRLTPTFRQSQYFQELVHRCVMHQRVQDSSNMGLPLHVHQHVVRCTNDDTQYFGDYLKSTRLSIVVPLQEPQVGTDAITEFFYFVCASSCPLGMNRKPIDIIFTLEDNEGEVFGRRVFGARICSCPKRDREKDEKDSGRSRAPPGKRARIVDDDEDTEVFKLNLGVVGKRNYLHLLDTAKKCMADEILTANDTNKKIFMKSYNEICNLIHKTTL